MDVRQTEDENKPLLSLYDRFALCDLFTLHIFERFRQNLEIGAGVALGEFVAGNGLEM